MIKKNSLFDFLLNVVFIYGISMISLNVFCLIFGESAKEISTMFALGNQGVPVNINMQFLAIAFFVAGFKWLYFTDSIIKNMSMALRTMLMFTSVILLMTVFIIVFKWFPVDKVLPWVLFGVCFFIYAVVSFLVASLKERSDNKKMQEALERLKEED